MSSADRFSYQRGTGFIALSPFRVFDTRLGFNSPLAKLGVGGTLSVDLSKWVPADATAVVLNLTATNVTASTYVTAYPHQGAIPVASNLNLSPGQTLANLVTVALGPGRRVDLYNRSGSVDLLADLAGYYSTTDGDPFVAVTPTRVLDTRIGQGAPRAKVGPGQSVILDVSAFVPSGTRAVVFNLTATNPTAATYVTAYSPAGAPVGASSLNVVAGQTLPNLVTIGINPDGKVGLYNHAGSVDLIADLAGYYHSWAASPFTPLPPTRALDTRTGLGAPVGRIHASGAVSLDLSGVIPAQATAVVLNLTAVNASGPTWVSAGPVPTLTSSNLNLVKGQTAANLVMVAVGPHTSIVISNHSSDVDLVADVAGYFAPGFGAARNLAETYLSTVTATSGVVSVSGDPASTQTTVLAAGSALPAVGADLVVPPGPAAADGLLGHVTAVTDNLDGTHSVTTAPTDMASAYFLFELTLSQDLATAETSLVQQRTAAGSATAVTVDLSAVDFTCTGVGGEPAITIKADLTRTHLDLDLDLPPGNLTFGQQRKIHALLSAAPVVEVHAAFSGVKTCVLADGSALRFSVPVPGSLPLTVVLSPSFTLTSDGTSSLDATWSPRFVAGFDKGLNLDSDFRAVDGSVGAAPAGAGGLTVTADFGLSIAVGGRNAVDGSVGAVLTSEGDPMGQPDCMRLTQALSVDLAVHTGVLTPAFAFTVDNGRFAQRDLFNSCA